MKRIFTLLSIAAMSFYGQAQIALDFDASANQYVDAGTGIGTALTGTNEFTVEAWIKLESAGTFRTVVSNYNGSMQYLLRVTNGKLEFYVDNGVFNNCQSVSNIPVGEWTHVAGSWDGTDQKVFINGILDHAISTAGSFSGNNNTTTISSSLGGEDMDGLIDDVRIWNITKTDSEILNDMNNCLVGSEPGLLALYNFETGSGTTLFDITGNGNDGTFINAPTWGTGIGCSIICPSDLTVAITDSELCPTNTGTTVTTTTSQNTISYFLRDDANDTIVDGPITGSGTGLSFNTGVLTNDMDYNVYGTTAHNSLSFDGIDDYIILPNESDYDFTTNMTVEFWINANSFDLLDGLVTKGDNSWRVHTLNTGEILFAGNGTFGDFQSTTQVNDGAWHHIAVSYDGANAKIYIDGVMENSVAATGTLANSTFPVGIGTNSQNLGRVFAGEMDEVRIWDITRTDAQINATMNIELVGDETGLVSYYNFNQGISEDDNTTITELMDNSTGTNNGTLTNFASTGTTSNWVDGANTTNCAFELSTIASVDVADNTAPVADVATLTILSDECSVAAPTAPTATDACMGAITGTTTTTFPMTITGTITWTYDDGNGNTSTQDQTVTINDATAPVADIATLSDITETCSVSSLTNPTATDNCAGTVTVTNDVTFPITESGIITWTYDDGNGNTSTQAQNVIINAPVIDVTTTTANFVITANNSTATGYQWIDCNNSNAAINGETNASYTALVNGDYAVIVIDGDCSDTSDCVNIAGLGINETQDLGVSIYPNPNNGEFTISTTENNVTITVYSADGKVIVNNLQVTEVNQLINLGDIENGIYFVKMANDINQKTIRLIVE